MAKYKFQVVIVGEAESPNREALQAMLATGVTYNLAIGGMIEGTQINVAPSSAIVKLHQQ